jgi:hypothetical protein
MRHQIRPRILPCRKRNHFLQNVSLLLVVPRNSVLRTVLHAVQALGIQAIHRKQLNLAAVNLLPQRVRQTPVFIVEKPALPCRKHHHAVAPLTRHQVTAPGNRGEDCVAIRFPLFRPQLIADREMKCASGLRAISSSINWFARRIRSIIPNRARLGFTDRNVYGTPGSCRSIFVAGEQ